MRKYIKFAHIQINDLGANGFVTSCANVNTIADEFKKIADICGKDTLPLEKINEKVIELKLKHRVKYLTDDMINQIKNDIGIEE